MKTPRQSKKLQTNQNNHKTIKMTSTTKQSKQPQHNKTTTTQPKQLQNNHIYKSIKTTQKKKKHLQNNQNNIKTIKTTTKHFQNNHNIKPLNSFPSPFTQASPEWLAVTGLSGWLPYTLIWPRRPLIGRYGLLIRLPARRTVTNSPPSAWPLWVWLAMADWLTGLLVYVCMSGWFPDVYWRMFVSWVCCG